MNYIILATEANSRIADAAAFGGLVGLFIGMLIGLFLLYLLNQTYCRNFKMYLLGLDEEERKEIYKELEDVYKILEKLAKTNTRIFKKWYNNLLQLKTYLKLKWMYN